MLFLLGEQMVARVDLKANRPRRRLDVYAAHLQDGHAPGAVAGPLVAELAHLARWLALDEVQVHGEGDLATALRRLAGSEAGES
jgi:uncharacterized protein YcaQ